MNYLGLVEEEAVYYIIAYDEQSYSDDNYYQKAEVNCYIRLDDKYLFACKITLRSKAYDSATDALIKELEVAYGIDMSTYYREEMMDGYMTGYMFWQGDLMLTDDSPSKERYHYYEMLKDMENGPYTLDWNMELEKSW